jgi:2,4-dienoyl-CoA reductase-like NADH-dependent reductase (Old Yellow Enzyme family)/thioredoxin reductase
MSLHFPMMFSPGRLGRLVAKNRLVMPPMVRNYADNQGGVTPRYIAHIERIARGGVGTIVLEASAVQADGKAFRRQLCIGDDALIPGLRALVDAGHRYETLMGIQLFHGGRQASTHVSGLQPIAPSPIPDPVVNELPHELEIEEIRDVVAAFATGARRAKQAGFDFVEIHGAHGYLVQQFLSPFSNRRRDEYGGSPENRRRFLEQIFAAVRAATGDDFPITLRLSGEEALPGGLTIEETVETAKRLEQLGAAALHISTGNYATYSQGTMIPPMAVADGVLLPLAERVKQAVGIPVIAVGKLRRPALVEDVLRRGQADFVALGRTLLADPDWPAKVASGRLAEVRHCVACNQGCITRLFAQEPIWCTINPEVGRESAFAHLTGGDGRKLLVVGGGAAGMAAARWGALAGFKVALHEAHAVLGGQLLAASTAPHREDWDLLREYLVHELDRLGVEVRLNSRLDPNAIVAEKAAAVILATGSEPVRPAIAGAEGMHVVTGRDILEQSVAHQGRIVIAGGGCAGAQTAEYLASCGHTVTVLEAEGDIAVDAPTDERNLLLGRLQHQGVTLMPNTRLISAALGNVVVHSPHETRMLPADMVVLCLGAVPTNGIAHVLKAWGVVHYVVGDAVKPRKVTEAIEEGALAVLNLLGVKLDLALLREIRRQANEPQELHHAV